MVTLSFAPSVFDPVSCFFPSSCTRYGSVSRPDSMCLSLHRHCALSQRSRLTKTGSARDHLLQFVLVAGTCNCGFQGDLLLEIRGRQRLVEGLHSELFLA